MPNGSIYVSYGNSETPSKASVNGSCTPTSTTGTANCTVDPEEARSYEIGTKWDVLGGNLALTAAVFRNDRTNYRVNDPVSPENPSGEQALDGQSRVDGLELGASGKLSQKWSAFANYTYLKSEVLQGASDAVDQGTDYSKGDDLVNVPEHSFNLWTTYELPYGLQVGYGVHYEGEVYLTQHNANNIPGSDGEVPLVKTESYFVHRASVSYQATPKLDLQLNINNLTDEEYYSRMRNNGWATPGDARAFILTANYDF
jgi:catecholate siderophore receptor